MNRPTTWTGFASVAARGLGLRPSLRPVVYKPVRNGPIKQYHSQIESVKSSEERKAARSSTSLRRVALEAQRSQSIIQRRGTRAHINPENAIRDVTAYCAAETYNLARAKQLMERNNFVVDPFNTSLYPQVLHVQLSTREAQQRDEGDIFIFPSGSVVTWNVTEELARRVVEQILPGAAENGHLKTLEAEDLEYVEDPTRDTSKIVGETIILGTKATKDAETAGDEQVPQKHGADVVLTKIAFSSALARSTKLAVLENLLSDYFATTRSIPSTLSAGSKLPFNRKFILQKTGQLLSLRAQLNLYSELTDALPDMFWDSPHELGLEGYYEQVGRALDVGSRINVLNERMDYASEIARVLRERLSEKHSNELEWLIIGLIAIEVLFECLKLWKEIGVSQQTQATDA
ncbi:DUF155-domain-containing protein [Piedraia hortae CBS 480.64]|uniref:DUF155-domain-containing protein n=1 Tax=Piedraia hortae CBS 480.64 TaxID=1314780 RepID=A0A6A7BWJ3_9PEZI|nr:DUF155-domain-containing protein [Piedraia hortae CBS 480.64]